MAVHSMKDVPTELGDDFTISAMLPRENPLDAFISERYNSLADLPQGATLGTCSLRRQAQLLAIRPDLNIETLRGSIETRLHSVQGEEYDATILACAGLRRMGLNHHIKEEFDLDQCLPAVGQGAIGIEVLSDAHHLIDLTQRFNHHNSFLCVNAERAMSRTLRGSCHSPIGGFAQIREGAIELRGIVANPDGSRILTAYAVGDDPEMVGAEAGEILLEQGASEYL